ncbi:MAG TPA: CBS domain-containing protein [Gammaproteobacteria bacterium]|jgi:CBS domain-containing protein|nr:CBS domain-containing protein [Gammaproteobacteria bacterium]
MLIKEIMSDHADILSPTDTIEIAAEKMRANNYGFLPVGENDRLIGTVTDRDIVIRAIAKGLDPQTPVKNILSDKVCFCFEDEDVVLAADKMQKLQIRRLIILNRNKRIVGIVSLGDIATRVQNNEISGETLEEISQA